MNIKDNFMLSKSGKYFRNISMYEGINATIIWMIYNLLPVNTHFTMKIFERKIVDDKCISELQDKVAFMKCIEQDISDLQILSLRENESHMWELFKSYGYNFTHFSMQWNKGFGNSVTVSLYL